MNRTKSNRPSPSRVAAVMRRLAKAIDGLDEPAVEGHAGLDDLRRRGDGIAPLEVASKPGPEDLCCLLYTSGTTGKPIVVAYTKEDVEIWTSVMVRTFACCGLTRGDVIQNAYGYGLFTGGLGAHYGAEALGATVIPISGGNTDRQIMVMKDFGVTVICCTPSYFLHLIERAGELGVSIKELHECQTE